MRSEAQVLAIVFSVALATLFLPSTAHAYLGPGGVITAVGAMLALLVAIVASIAGFLWYPLKRFLLWFRGIRSSRGVEAATGPVDSTGG